MAAWLVALSEIGRVQYINKERTLACQSFPIHELPTTRNLQEDLLEFPVLESSALKTGQRLLGRYPKFRFVLTTEVRYTFYVSTQKAC